MIPKIIVLLIFSIFARAGVEVYDISTKDKPLAISYESSRLKSSIKHNMVPIGAAALTRSGKLEKSGIKYIIHVASGSMTSAKEDFRPSLAAIEQGLKNSFKLLELKKIKKVAIPFIGSGIFRSRIGLTKKQLAKKIIKTLNSFKKRFAITIVAYSSEDYNLFNSVINYKEISLVKGSITNFKDHNAPVILNAANTELLFGGGLSGHIGSKTKQSKQIDQELNELKSKLASEKLK